MRLFTAIELTDEARAAIVAEQRRFVGSMRSPGGLRLVRPEHLHLTLVFIGEVAEELGAAIASAMTRELPVPRFRLVFGGIGAFPPRGAPRVLYLGVTDGARDAIEAYAEVLTRLGGLGVGGESRPYRPHLTLGRWRESRPADRPRSTEQSPVARIDVTEVVLFQSRLSSSGPTYIRLATASLGTS